MKKYEIVHASRGGKREAKYSCANDACENKVARKGDLCAQCERQEDAADKQYALR